MNWTQLINLLEALCLALLCYRVWTLGKAKLAAERKIEGFEKKLHDMEDMLTGFGATLGRETADIKDRVSELEAANEDYHDFDAKLMNGLQGLLDYDMTTAAGGGK